MVMEREMENLQKLNKSLAKQYAELKCEKIALNTKVETVSIPYLCINYLNYACVYKQF